MKLISKNLKDFVISKGRFPSLAKNGKGVGGNGIKFMIACHNEAGFCGDGAELSNDELNLREVVIIQNIVLFKLIRTIATIIKVDVVSNENVAGLHEIFQEDEFVIAWNWV